MITIYKYQLSLIDYQKLKLPFGSEILTIQTQRNIPCIWVKIDTEIKETIDVEIYIKGTGHDLKNVDGSYLGTFQLDNGTLIFHTWYKYKN